MDTAVTTPPLATPTPAIEVNQVSTRFGDHVVHSDVTLNVNQGEIFALIGGSGSGKSTLLREMILLQSPNAGNIKVLGTDLKNLDEAQALALRQRWGVMFQHGGLFGSLDVRENVGLPLREHTPLDDASIDAIAALKIALTGLTPETGRQFPSELSGGMMKRASLARALALDPEVLICDEAVSALDVSVQAQVLKLLEEIQAQLNLAILFITHDLRVAAQICDRVLVMQRGEVVEQGTARDVFVTPKHAYTQRLLASAPGLGFEFGANLRSIK